MSVEQGEQNGSIVSRRVFDGTPTPSKLLGFLDKIRHPNGAVDLEHPGIEGVMRQAEKDRLDVLLVPRGDGIDAVAGRFLANDHKRLIRIGAGVAISTVIAAGAVGFVLRRHKR